MRERVLNFDLAATEFINRIFNAKSSYKSHFEMACIDYYWVLNESKEITAILIGKGIQCGSITEHAKLILVWEEMSELIGHQMNLVREFLVSFEIKGISSPSVVSAVDYVVEVAASDNKLIHREISRTLRRGERKAGKRSVAKNESSDS